MDSPPRLPPKKDVALALLQGPSLFVHLDPRKERVVVPKNFRKQSRLVLQVGLNMPVPIPDLEVDEDGITCTLSFSHTPFWCRLPWSAVFALVGEDGRGMVWPKDVPPEIAKEARRPSLKVVESKKKEKPRARLHLASKPPAEGLDASLDEAPTQLIDSHLTSSPASSADRTDAPLVDPQTVEQKTSKARKSLPPYLRVVK